MVMDWDNGGWRVEGRALDATTQQRAQLLSALEQFGPSTPTELSERIGKTANAVKQLLARMLEKGMVSKVAQGRNTRYAAVPKFGREPGEPFEDHSVPF
jgi:DNA-binding MarR family transcriptional regulator